MHISDIWNVIRRSWLLIISAVLLSVAAAAALSLLQTPQYTATSKMLVTTQSSSNIAELQQGTTFTQSAVKSFADVLTTQLILEPVITELGLDETPAELRERVRATAPLDTVILEVTAEDESPVQAARIANAIATTFADTVDDLVPTAADGTPQVKVSALEPAVPDDRPSSPNVVLSVLIAAVLGAFAGIGIAALRRALDDRLHGPTSVEALTDAPILGGIPWNADAIDKPLVVRSDPRGPAAEAYRRVRANLRYLGHGDDARVYIVTSAIEGEGKTTTSINLALALAESGVATCLVDADLRRPTVASTLGIEGGVGLSDVLVGTAELNEVIQPWGDANLYVLPSGSRPPNPGDLVASADLRELFAVLGREFETVLVDAPPLLPVADASIMARSANGALVVASAESVTKNQFTAALAALEASGARTAGVVVSMVPTGGSAAEEFGNYSYAYEGSTT